MKVKISLIQPGPQTVDIEQNRKALLATMDEVGEKERPDFVVCGELSYLPYIAAVLDKKYFDWAETIPGETTERFGEIAQKHSMCIILGMFEKVIPNELYHNSTVVFGPDGNIVEGTYPDGRKALRYIKSHMPYNVSIRSKYYDESVELPPNWGTSVTPPEGYQRDGYDETYYFATGDGWPVFDTPKAKIGVATCFDRHFPEPYRILALQGAEIIFTSSVAMGFRAKEGASSMADTYLLELQVRALENSVWLATVNKTGTEYFEGKSTYCYGNSAIIHPSGGIVARGSEDKEEVVSQEIDLKEIEATRRVLPLFKQRRPELYGLISKKL